MAMPYWLTCGAEDDDGAEARLTRRRIGRSVRASLEPPAPLTDRCSSEAMALRCSTHACLRLAQRCLTWEQLDYVLSNGAQIWRTGALFHVLRRCDIAPADRRAAEIARLEGAVVVTDDDRVITVYRNRHGYRDIRKKQRYYRPDRRLDSAAMWHEWTAA